MLPLRHDVSRRLLVSFVVVAVAGCFACAGTAAASFPGDNGRIAFERYSGSPAVISLAADGTGAATLRPLGFSPAWSPDGAKIALMYTKPGASLSTIHVMNADGSGLVDVGPPPEDVPDSVAFVDDP